VNPEAHADGGPQDEQRGEAEHPGRLGARGRRLGGVGAETALEGRERSLERGQGALEGG